VIAPRRRSRAAGRNAAILGTRTKAYARARKKGTPAHAHRGGVALVFQGGGALCAYQAGVYEALADYHTAVIGLREALEMPPTATLARAETALSVDSANFSA
jgi:hypothetical protein